MGAVAKILVVEDDPDVRALVVRRLQSAGHRVHGALDATDATAAISERGAPDVVVLDVTMPGIGGLQLLGRVREQTGQAELPAVFLSGRVAPEDIAAGRALGAVYLTKPFVGSALLGAIDAILARTQPVSRLEW